MQHIYKLEVNWRGWNISGFPPKSIFEQLVGRAISPSVSILLDSRWKYRLNSFLLPLEGSIGLFCVKTAGIIWKKKEEEARKNLNNVIVMFNARHLKKRDV